MSTLTSYEVGLGELFRDSEFHEVLVLNVLVENAWSPVILLILNSRLLREKGARDIRSPLLGFLKQTLISSFGSAVQIRLSDLCKQLLMRSLLFLSLLVTHWHLLVGESGAGLSLQIDIVNLATNRGLSHNL